MIIGKKYDHQEKIFHHKFLKTYGFQPCVTVKRRKRQRIHLRRPPPIKGKIFITTNVGFSNFRVLMSSWKQKHFLNDIRVQDLFVIIATETWLKCSRDSVHDWLQEIHISRLFSVGLFFQP